MSSLSEIGAQCVSLLQSHGVSFSINKMDLLCKLNEEIKEAADAKESYPAKDCFEYEIADIVMVCSGICHLLGVDIDQMISEKMEINKHRFK